MIKVFCKRRVKVIIIQNVNIIPLIQKEKHFNTLNKRLNFPPPLNKPKTNKNKGEEMHDDTIANHLHKDAMHQLEWDLKKRFDFSEILVDALMSRIQIFIEENISEDLGVGQIHLKLQQQIIIPFPQF